MSESPETRRELHLIIEGLTPTGMEALLERNRGSGDRIEVMKLTEGNARAALQKIFASESVMVWGDVG